MKAHKIGVSAGRPKVCRTCFAAALLAGAFSLTGVAWANGPLEWKYDTSGRTEKTPAESAVSVSGSFLAALSYTVWSVGFDLDTTGGFYMIIR